MLFTFHYTSSEVENYTGKLHKTRNSNSKLNTYVNKCIIYVHTYYLNVLPI